MHLNVVEIVESMQLGLKGLKKIKTLGVDCLYYNITTIEIGIFQFHK